MYKNRQYNVAGSIIKNLKILVIQVNRQCNLRCIFCCNDDGDKSVSIPVEKVKELIRTFPNLETLILTGGESFIYIDYVFGITEFARKWNKKINIQVNTTGIILNDKILARLKKSVDVIHLSVNTLKPDIFKHIKGASPIFMNLINKNIRKYIKAGFDVIVDNVVGKYNVGEVLEIYRKCERWGVEDYAVSQMIINGRAKKEMLAEFPAFKKMIVDLLHYHKKRVKSGSTMHLELWCLYSEKLREYRDFILDSKIPKSDTTVCCCGSEMLYVSAEGYVMPCSLGFNHMDFKDCDINIKSLPEILNTKPIFRLINLKLQLCHDNGVCKVFNKDIRGTFYD